MTHIYTDIWQSLETTSSIEGYVRRRIKSESVCDLFLAVTKPFNQRLLHIQLTEALSTSISSLPSFRGVDVSVLHADNKQQGYTLQVALKDRRFATIFDILVDDITDVLAGAQSQSAAVKLLIGRLRYWQRFLERVEPDGLSKEAQQGLYGELWFLRERLIPLIGHYSALLAWTGPAGASHDFLHQSCAIEIKTTGTKEPQQMIIQSEQQLDNAGLAALFLFHLALNVREGAGESLISCIDSLREILSIDPPALELFEDRLQDTGFLQIQASLYDRTGYYVRRASLFQVRDAFPRIIGADLKPGVGSVRYSIAEAECRHFAATEQELQSQLAGFKHGK